MSWVGDENGFSDEDNSDKGHATGKSWIPKMKQNRKRSSASAGLQEFDFVADFERRLKLTPSTLERLKVADELIKDPCFVLTLMKSLSESYVRKLAMTCTKWRTLAYKTLRNRKGRNAFSLLWMDNADESESEEGGFDFSVFHHPAYLGGSAAAAGTFVTASNSKNTLPLQVLPENCIMDTAGASSNVINPSINTSEHSLMKPNEKVTFILTYGSSNMEADFMTLDESTIDCTSLMILSSSVIATTPDGKEMVDAVGSTSDRKLVTSIMFPQCTHILFECFVVPSIIPEGSPACISNVTENLGPVKKPKALILYQYLNLLDSKPGIVEVLQALKMTHGSAGFPMVTGIYNFLDANLTNQKSSVPVACGLLICGDDFCHVSVISVNLASMDNGTLEAYFQQIDKFYGAAAFTTKYSLLFYHNEVTNPDSIGALPFKHFIDCFRRRFSDVNLHGMGSLSGAHAMFVNADSNQSFNQLNIRMMELTATEHSKTSPASLDVVLLLLAYQTE